jgi:hypothetical protein
MVNLQARAEYYCTKIYFFDPLTNNSDKPSSLVSFAFKLHMKDSRKNIAFTSLIKIGGRLCEFNFRKRGASYYDVDTHDDRGNRHYFKMEKQEDSWIINNNNVPDWLLKNETLINTAIKKEEQEISGN